MPTWVPSEAHVNAFAPQRIPVGWFTNLLRTHRRRIDRRTERWAAANRFGAARRRHRFRTRRLVRTSKVRYHERDPRKCNQECHKESSGAPPKQAPTDHLRAATYAAR